MSALGLGCVETPKERRHKVVEVGEARGFSELILCPHRCDEWLNADDVHDAGEIVGEYV